MEHSIETIGAFLEEHVVFKKVGGLYHWRIGRIGGSFYMKKKSVAKIVTRYKADPTPITAPLQITGPSADRVSLAMARIHGLTNS